MKLIYIKILQFPVRGRLTDTYRSMPVFTGGSGVSYVLDYCIILTLFQVINNDLIIFIILIMLILLYKWFLSFLFFQSMFFYNGYISNGVTKKKICRRDSE